LAKSLSRPEIRSLLPPELRPELDAKPLKVGRLTKLRRTCLERVDPALAAALGLAVAFAGLWIVFLLPFQALETTLRNWQVD
ncbi:MAG: hypothetical protein JO069_17835, partial [Verrucomicrobia bacterium]|nr:hypothetical protein [Verrucomicrobiota bacterium]